MSKRLRYFLDRLSANALRRMINLWPPFLGAGIKIKSASSDFRRFEIVASLRWYNKNYVGTHFGGTMLSMTDPFFMLILLKNLGKDYIVWDKASAINFKKVGRGTLRALFQLTEAEIQEIRDKVEQQQKYIFDRQVDILDDTDEVVASVVKTLYVKKKSDAS